jgi:hypothetical protein
VLLIAVCVLAPFAGVTPSGVDMRSVSAVQLVTAVAHVRANVSANPPGFGAVAPRFLAVDTKATKSPPDAIEGAELAPLPGVVPSAVETRNVVGEQVVLVTPLHVSRTKTCGVTPSNVAFETRLVASDTNATKRESGLITGLKLSPFPALTPSAAIETSCVPVVVDDTGRQNTCRVVPLSGAEVVKFEAVDVNATVAPPESIVGSQLGPFAEFPFGSTLTSAFAGVQLALPRHVLRTKTLLKPFVSVVTRLLEIEANATIPPLLLVEGPAVMELGVPVAHMASVPQIPFAACEPSGAKSRMIGNPTDAVGFTAKT